MGIDDMGSDGCSPDGLKCSLGWKPEDDWDWNEYDAVANWCAQRRHFNAEQLPQLVSAPVMREINEHPDEFRERINACAYALAREGYYHA